MTSAERKEGRFQRRKAARDQRKQARLADALDFDRVFTFIHHYRSAQLCFRNVRWKGSVQAFKSRCGINVARRQRELKSGVLKLKRCPEFYIRERGHVRRINTISITDRVPQKCNSKYALKPVMHRSLIYDNYASQECKGTALARKRLQCRLERHIRRYGMTGGMIVFDFTGFFDSVQHGLIRYCLGRNFDDKRIIGFNMKIVRQYREKVGMILGSENSQDFAIAVPNMFDHFICEKMRVEGYGRYMDDGIIIDPDYERLKTVYQEIRKLAEWMGFKLNSKKSVIIRFGQPFTYLQRKYSFTETGKIIKRPTRSSVIRERRKLKRLHNKFIEGKLTIETAQNSVKAWKASIAGTRCHKVEQSINKLYDELFIEEWLSGEEDYKCFINSCQEGISSMPATA